MFKDYMYKLLNTNNTKNINSLNNLNNVNNIKNNIALQKYILNSTHKSIENKCNKNNTINYKKLNVQRCKKQQQNNNEIAFFIFTFPILLYL